MKAKDSEETKIPLDKDIHSGKPVIKGTRVPVDVVLGKLASGMTYEDIMQECAITKDDILCALDYARKLAEYQDDTSKDRLDYTGYMAAIFAKRFLFDAPADMIESQIKELERLTPLQLCAFIEIESFPIPRENREKLIEVVGESVVERLDKRRNAANVIAEAKANDLYEIEEQKTGMLDSL